MTRRKYVEAKKAFQFAHALDPKNLQIVIDLADLQVQVGDYAGYRVSKQKLMNERSSDNNYWLGFIMGAYLDNKFDLCVDIITTFRETLDAKPSYCRQELLFIESDCYARKKDWENAIRVLEKGMGDIREGDARPRLRLLQPAEEERGAVARTAERELRQRPLLQRHRMVRALIAHHP